LNGHHFDLGEVVLVVEDRRAGDLLEAMGSGDVVDVGVGDDDLFDGERVFGEESEDAGDVVAGVDDDGFAGGLVAEDGAVALEGADGEDFVDHGSSRVMANGWRSDTGLAGGEADPLRDDRKRGKDNGNGECRCKCKSNCKCKCKCKCGDSSLRSE